MSYLVLARKWRPQNFADLIGQEHVSQTLKNAIDGGRVAHAFLFTGARGVGKTSSARILAKALNCEQGPAPEPCNACPICSEITAGNSVDVFEIDGASNTGVDDIRELRDNIKYLPSRSRFKIFIIDEVHMLSTSAFNALLKTLEEPPPHVKFIFATTEPHKVPITILSRCQRFDFKRISLPMIVGRLRHIVSSENIAISDFALATVARKGDGSMRDSLSTLDQVLAFCGETVADEEVITLLGIVDRRLLHETSDAVFDRDTRAVLDIVRRVDAYGSSMRHFCQELIEYFRNLMLLHAAGDDADLSELSETEVEELRIQVKKVPLPEVQRHLSLLVKAESEMAHSSFPRLIMEMALVKMATLVPVVPVDELIERLKMLEGKTGNGVVSAPQPAWEKPARAPERRESPIVRSSEAAPAAGPATAPVERAEASREHAAEEKWSAGGDWPDFVAFVKEKKRMLASLLEHGRPLKISAGTLEIAFPPGSFGLESLKQPDIRSDLKSCADSFFGRDTEIKIIPLAGDSGSAPLSLAEKKRLESAEKLTKMRNDAAAHPAVMAALDVFGGELVGAVSDTDREDA